MNTRGLTLLLSLIALPGSQACKAAAAASAAVAVKVMIVSMYQPEATPWLKALKVTREIPVPGLLQEYPLVRCTAQGVCQMTTGAGHANAAASIMAVAYSRLFDLRKTYFLIAGTAGIDPDRGTIGSAAWARYVVDVGLAQEIDARDMPGDWKDGYFGFLTNDPDQKPKLAHQTEVFRLNEALLQKALVLSKGVTLEDADDIKSYRAHFGMAPANEAPKVTQCDTLSGDTWWAGPHLEAHARHWVRLLTDDAGVYCTTQEEDNATLNALTRAAASGLADVQRVAVLRTGSDFDRPYDGQTAVDSLRTQQLLHGALATSTDNLVRAGMPLVQAIVSRWPQWQQGVPAD